MQLLPPSRWLFVVALVGTTSVVDADEPEKNEVESATELFRQAADHYREGRFSVAAELLEEAYALRPEPVLLYNLGRARESDGDAEGAIAAYTRYLEGDSVSDRRGVRARINRLNERLTQERELARLRAEKRLRPRLELPASKPIRESVAPHVVATKVKPSVARPELGRAPLLVVGLGAVTMAAALPLGLLARSERKAAENASEQLETAELGKRADRFALATNVALGVGGVVLVSGIIWVVARERRGLRQPAVSLLVSGNQVAISGSF